MSWKNVFGGIENSSRNGSTGPVGCEVLAEPHELLQAHRERLNALRLESGYQAVQFDRLVGTTVRQVAEWVYMLPATHSDHHSETAGLLRLALETSCLAYRRADGKFLAGSGTADVHYRDRDRVWRYAAFLGGLLRPLGRTVTYAEVVSRDGLRWDALEESLWGWLRRTGSRRVEIVWRGAIDGRPTHVASSWIASRIISPATLRYLHEADKAVPEALLCVMQDNHTGRLCEIVEEALQSAIDLDLAVRTRCHSAGGALAFEHRLLETLRSLAREKWTMNTPGGRLWLTDGGVFLAWKTAANEVLVRLRSEGIEGAPADADALAQLLLAQGILVPNPQPVGAFKHYYKLVPIMKGVPKLAIDVVKIADAELLGLHIDGVEPIEAGNNGVSPAPKDRESERSAQPVALELPLPDPTVRESAQPLATRPEGQRAPPTAPATSSGVSLDRLNRFGAAGRVLKQLGERLVVEANGAEVALVPEGLAVSFPDAIAPYCEQPQEFLASCEAQGLIVPAESGSARILRCHPSNGSRLPGRFVVLAPRIARHFAFLADKQ